MNFNQYQVPIYLLLPSEYSMISNKGYCKLVSGKLPYHCDRSNVTSKSMCEDHCTTLSSCVAYDYNTLGNFCELFPSVRSCPSGFTPYSESAPIATKMNDLIATSGGNTWGCYGKN